MGERKVLNKYFSPDFDPSLVPRHKRPKNLQCEVRMMLPFSLQCNTCGEYMYRGKKFNSRKEDVIEETYHGIRIFRFYIKCITCSSEITFKTDPKRGDYVVEHGAQRNFEIWRENEEETENALKQRQAEEEGDAMKVLENRTLDSKREMDILDALDEIKAINQRHAKIDTETLLQVHANADIDKTKIEQQKKELQEDQEQAKRVFQMKKRKLPPTLHEKPSISEKDVSIHSTSTMPTLTIRTKLKKKKDFKTIQNTKKTDILPLQVPLSSSLVADYSDSSTE